MTIARSCLSKFWRLGHSGSVESFPGSTAYPGLDARELPDNSGVNANIGRILGWFCALLYRLRIGLVTRGRFSTLDSISCGCRRITQGGHGRYYSLSLNPQRNVYQRA